MIRKKWLGVIGSLILGFGMVSNAYADVHDSVPKFVDNEFINQTEKLQESDKFVQVRLSGGTLTVCKKCYCTWANAICNRDQLLEATKMHGNCTYRVYSCTVNYSCPSCGSSGLLSDIRHTCFESHINCGLGRLQICRING